MIVEKWRFGLYVYVVVGEGQNEFFVVWCEVVEVLMFEFVGQVDCVGFVWKYVDGLNLIDVI